MGEPFGGVSMTGHESEHGLALQGFTGQSLGEIDPVDHVVLGITLVQYLQDRRIEIVCLNAGLVD